MIITYHMHKKVINPVLISYNLKIDYYFLLHRLTVTWHVENLIHISNVTGTPNVYTIPVFVMASQTVWMVLMNWDVKVMSFKETFPSKE